MPIKERTPINGLKKQPVYLYTNLYGLEVRVENNRIVKVRGEKDNPLSEGYVCRKGLNIIYHQHHADRLMYPLKKIGETFEKNILGTGHRRNS